MRKIVFIATATIVSLGTALETRAEKTCDCGIEGHETECCWEIDGKTLKITGTGEMANYSGSCSTSSTSCTHSAPWGIHEGEFTSIDVQGVTKIGNNAFYGFFDVTSAKIGDSVKSIGNAAFSSNSLTEVNIPSGVNVGKYAFDSQGYMKNEHTLTSVTIGEGVVLDERVFQGNGDSLTELIISDKLTAADVKKWANNALYNYSQGYSGNNISSIPISTIKCQGEIGEMGDVDNCQAALGRYINNCYSSYMSCISSDIPITAVKGPACPKGCSVCNSKFVCLSCGENFNLNDGECDRIRYTPAEAAEVLTNDNNNSVTITFKI